MSVGYIYVSIYSYIFCRRYFVKRETIIYNSFRLGYYGLIYNMFLVNVFPVCIRIQILKTFRVGIFIIILSGSEMLL